MRLRPDLPAARTRGALFCLLIVASACADPVPRPLYELGRTDGRYVDPRSGEPYTGPVFDLFDDGSGAVSERAQLVDGLYHGPRERYHANGRLRSMEMYQSGVRHGRYEWYNEVGLLFEIGTYRNGIQEGPYRAYWQDGDVEETGTYRSGALDGPRTWRRGRDVVERVTYRAGAIVGPYERYRPDGTIELKGQLVAGEPCGLWWHGHTPVAHRPCSVDAQ